MRVIRPFALLALAFASACSTGGGGDASSGPESVASWTCCGFGPEGESCQCYEDVPGSAHGCFPSVAACAQVDAGATCCTATRTGEGWLCRCWPDATDCASVMRAGSQSVASCPP